jgi:stage III sporulation protein AG
MKEKEPNKTTLVERLTIMMGLKPNQVGMVKMMAIGLALGILFLNAGELFGLEEGSSRPADTTLVSAPADSSGRDELVDLEREIGNKLERTLSLIQGTGAVRVAVTLEAGPEAVPVINSRVQETTTDEKAGDSSTRRSNTTQKDQSSVVTRDGSRDSLALLKRSRAQIAGVLIVAEGAQEITVRARIHEAAVTALGIAAHRVSVVPAEGR